MLVVTPKGDLLFIAIDALCDENRTKTIVLGMRSNQFTTRLRKCKGLDAHTFIDTFGTRIQGLI